MYSGDINDIRFSGSRGEVRFHGLVDPFQCSLTSVMSKCLCSCFAPGKAELLAHKMEVLIVLDITLVM